MRTPTMAMGIMIAGLTTAWGWAATGTVTLHKTILLNHAGFTRGSLEFSFDQKEMEEHSRVLNLDLKSGGVGSLYIAMAQSASSGWVQEFGSSIVPLDQETGSQKVYVQTTGELTSYREDVNIDYIYQRGPVARTVQNRRQDMPVMSGGIVWSPASLVTLRVTFPGRIVSIGVGGETLTDAHTAEWVVRYNPRGPLPQRRVRLQATYQAPTVGRVESAALTLMNEWMRQHTTWRQTAVTGWVGPTARSRGVFPFLGIHVSETQSPQVLTFSFLGKDAGQVGRMANPVRPPAGVWYRIDRMVPKTPLSAYPGVEWLVGAEGKEGDQWVPCDPFQYPVKADELLSNGRSVRLYVITTREREGGQVDRGVEVVEVHAPPHRLGVTYQTVSAQALGLPYRSDFCFQIETVVAGSRAEAVGLHVGDVIVEVDELGQNNSWRKFVHRDDFKQAVDLAEVSKRPIGLKYFRVVNMQSQLHQVLLEWVEKGVPPVAPPNGNMKIPGPLRIQE